MNSCMQNNNLLLTYSLARRILVIASLTLYTLFLIIDILPAAIAASWPVCSTYIKYLSVILCFAAALTAAILRHSVMPALPLALTLFADTFLLLMNSYYIIGVSAFAAVQTIYGIYLMVQAAPDTSHSICFSRITNPVIRILLYLITITALSRISSIDILAGISLWSYTQLLLNVIHSFLLAGKARNSDAVSDGYTIHLSLLSVGLLLFFACDTCVGLSNIESYMPGMIGGAAYHIISYLMWVFYLPSQVCIVYSFLTVNKEAPAENGHTKNI